MNASWLSPPCTDPAASSAGPSHPPPPRQVLVIGSDTSLLWTRACLMRSVGCPVFSALPEDAVSALAVNLFSIVIFGYSLSDDEAAQLATFARENHPTTTLLLLTSHPPQPQRVSSLFDHTIDTLEDSGPLTRTVHDLLARCA